VWLRSAPAPGFGLRAAPNPFNPSTRLLYTIDRPGFVSLTVHDLHGRLVARLLEGNMPVGEHEVVWDGSDVLGRTASSGIYLVRLVGEDGSDGLTVTLGK
jgi:hypothetical protein